MQVIDNQKGIAAVELCLVTGLFFVLLIAVFEIGRVMYTLNVLDNTTREGARLAAVCPVDESDRIKALALVVELQGFSSEHIQIQYLDEDFNLLMPVDAGAINAEQFIRIRYVRSSIAGYQMPLFIPFLSGLIPVPSFSTTLPSESLGILPYDPTQEGFHC